MNTKILILASNPDKTRPLKLQKEIERIEEIFEASPNRDRFVIQTNYSVRAENLIEILLKEKPNIVHFCGHGEGEKGLVIEDDLGQPHLIRQEPFAKAISHCEETYCVLLNACNTDIQAKEITKYINYAIGMRQPILDPSAIAYSRGFYTALAYRKTISEAHHCGCNQIELGDSKSSLQRNASVSRKPKKQERIAEHLTPELFINEKLKQDKTLEKQIVQYEGLETQQDSYFRKLETYLSQGKWREADEFTRWLLLSLTESNSIEDAVKTISCEHLQIVDKLWFKYSQERFGFSVQILIYETLARNEIRWSRKIGWRKPNFLDIIRQIFKRSLFGWIPYDRLQFYSNAPKGHLPALGVHGYGTNGRLPLLEQLYHKIKNCNIG